MHEEVNKYNFNKRTLSTKVFTNLVVPYEIRETGYLVGEISNHVDRRGEKIVELLSLPCLRGGRVAGTRLPILRVV